MEHYLIAKALHLMAIVAWFGGQFYLVRLFVYHVEAFDKPDPDRRILHQAYSLMEKRLSSAILTPALVMLVVFGVWLMVGIHAWTAPWFHLKLVLLVGLFAYHGLMSRVRKRLAEGIPLFSSVQLRVWNEVATLFLVAIVFTAVLKDLTAIGVALAWTAGLAIPVGWMMRNAYKKKGMLGHKPKPLPPEEPAPKP
jgi:putative membrane protein